MPARTQRKSSPPSRRRSPLRRLRANLRDTWVLVGEFREALILFALTLVVGALSFQALWNAARPGDHISSLEALYDVLSMTFFTAAIALPDEWFLAAYFFIMPALGLAVLARGAADFVTLLFNRSLRQSQWEEAVASTFRDHVIICGLGRLGTRVVRELVALDEDVVVVEQKSDSIRFAEMRASGVPVIVGDGRDPATLAKAGLGRAKSVIICTNDDLMNLQMAGRIRELNQSVRLIMRMFDDDFGRTMADSFGLDAVFSASLLAAPAFAGAAAGTEIIQTFKVADKVLAMGRVEVQRGSKLVGMTLAAVEHKLDLSVVLLQSGDVADIQPDESTALRAGDVVAVVGALPSITALAAKWNRVNAR